MNDTKARALETLEREAERLLALREQIDAQIARIQASIDYYAGTEARVQQAVTREVVRGVVERAPVPERKAKPGRPSGNAAFTPARVAFIRKNYKDMDNTQLRIAANRMPGPKPISNNDRISWWLSTHGLKRGPQMTPERTQFVLENHMRMDNGELRRALNEMPGPRIMSNQAISYLLWKHNIRRGDSQKLFRRREESETTTADAEA